MCCKRYNKINALMLLFFIVAPFMAETQNVSQIYILKKQIKLASPQKQVGLCNELGRLYMTWNTDSSLFYHRKALKMADSLNMEKEKGISINRIGLNYLDISENDSALNCFREFLTICEKLNDKEGLVWAYLNIGLAESQVSRYNSALINLEKSKFLAKVCGDTLSYANSMINLGLVYQDLSEYDKASAYYHKALKLYEKKGDLKGQGNCLNNLGLTYYYLGDYENAENYYVKALALFEKLNYKRSVAMVNNNIALILFEKGEYEKSNLINSKVLALNQETGSKKGIATTYINIGRTYRAMGKNNMVLPYLDSALTIFVDIEDHLGECNIYIKKGEFLNQVKQYTEAVESFRISETICSKYNFTAQYISLYEGLSFACEKLNKYPDALKYSRLMRAYNDSVNNKEIQKNVSKLRILYEAEKQQQRINILTKENEISELKLSKVTYLTVSIIIISILMFIIVYYRIERKKIKIAQNLVQAEQKLLRVQMNPHFIFNSLTAIQDFMSENNSLKSGKYISDFANLIRNILENSRSEYISLEKEIKTLKYYLDLQKLRYNDSFDYKIIIDKDVDISSVLIPPMFAQPYIENSIEHGFVGMKEGGLIVIEFLIKGKYLNYSITDNGVGINNSKNINNDGSVKHLSVATDITKERLNIFNNISHENLELNIIDINDVDPKLKGTKVSFRLPIKK